MVSRNLRKKDTPHELLVLEWVRSIGLGANSQEDFPPYVVDVYIPDMRLAIEIDGPLHFSKRDKKRDQVLMDEHGVDVWRLPLKILKASYKEEFISMLMEKVEEQTDEGFLNA